MLVILCDSSVILGYPRLSSVIYPRLSSVILGVDMEAVVADTLPLVQFFFFSIKSPRPIFEFFGGGVGQGQVIKIKVKTQK